MFPRGPAGRNTGVMTEQAGNVIPGEAFVRGDLVTLLDNISSVQ